MLPLQTVGETSLDLPVHWWKGSEQRAVADNGFVHRPKGPDTQMTGT